MSFLETKKDQSGPRIIQLTIFLPNRVGSLLSIVRILEVHNIKLCAISILDSADHAVVRMVVNRPELAFEALRSANHEVFRTELLGVVVPSDAKMGPKHILSALITAEVNVHYMYSLMTPVGSPPVIALSVDDARAAERVFNNHGLKLVGQDEIDD